MTYDGQVQNGVVVFENGTALPEGTHVRVVPVVVELQNEHEQPRTIAERFANVIGKAKDLPEDFAENHDHYIHGTPKK
jgi:hypothetical protein